MEGSSARASAKILINFRLDPFYLLFQTQRRRVLRVAILLLVLLCGDRAQPSSAKQATRVNLILFMIVSSHPHRVTTSTQAVEAKDTI